MKKKLFIVIAFLTQYAQMCWCSAQEVPSLAQSSAQDEDQEIKRSRTPSPIKKKDSASEKTPFSRGIYIDNIDFANAIPSMPVTPNPDPLNPSLERPQSPRMVSRSISSKNRSRSNTPIARSHRAHSYRSNTPDGGKIAENIAAKLAQETDERKKVLVNAAFQVAIANQLEQATDQRRANEKVDNEGKKLQLSKMNEKLDAISKEQGDQKKKLSDFSEQLNTVKNDIAELKKTQKEPKPNAQDDNPKNNNTPKFCGGCTIM